MLSPSVPLRLRKALLNEIVGSVVSLAKDPSGSHVIDACWEGTQGIRHYREQIARALADQADSIRNDFFGKRVWKNWNMDAYVSGRFDWGRQDGAQEGRFAKMPVVKKSIPREEEAKGKNHAKKVEKKASFRSKSKAD
jgi:nucleolar protein 9